MPPPPQQRRFSRLMYGGAALAAIGICLAVSLTYIHAQIDKSAGAYTSFCNVNDSVNCDRVLTSPFASFAGIPVAWCALAAYIALFAAFMIAATSTGSRRHMALRLAAAGAVGSMAYSIYMAVVSLFVLQTICLMCSGLYLVAIGMIAVIAVTPEAYREAGGKPEGILPGGLGGSLLAALAAVGVVAVATWPSGQALTLSTTADLQSIKESDEEFFDWYTALPRVDAAMATGGLDTGDKPVTIVEFSDFECGFCRKNHTMLAGLKDRLGDLVNVVYRHFPLDAACNDALKTSLHKNACRAAQAAECARAQGRFDEMVNALFENQSRLFEEMITKLATRLELDTDAFAQCMEGDESLKRVIADARAGERLKLTSTPTLFINGRHVKGTFESPEGYDRAVLIEAALAAGETLD